MKYELSVEERDGILAGLSGEQRDFLHHDLLRSRRTIFAQNMARAKGASIPEDATYEDVERFLDGWVYTGYVDAGEPSPEYPCECGRPLRYQHEVRHKTTGAVLHFGIVHLGEHLQLDPKTVALIIKGFDVLDVELDEILVKHRSGWELERALAGRMPEGFPLPADITAQLELKLPLLDKQVARLRKRIIEYLEELTLQRVLANRSPRFQLPPVQEKQLGVTKEEHTDFVLEDDQLTLFFPEPQLSAPEAVDRNSQMGFSGSEVLLPEPLEERVQELLLTGTGSVRVMAEMLLSEGAADQRRYSTGKPHLYVPICIYIDEVLVPAGFCHPRSISSEDRRYGVKQG